MNKINPNMNCFPIRNTMWGVDNTKNNDNNKINYILDYTTYEYVIGYKVNSGYTLP